LRPHDLPGSLLALIFFMRDVGRAHGFTLTESVVACALLATALLSVGHLSSGAMALQAQARERTLATVLAVSKLEELRGSAMPASGADTVDSRGQPAAIGTSRVFERHWSVATVSADASILTVQVAPYPRRAGRDVRILGGWMVVRR
jgi:type II secretion system protein I